MYVLSFAEQGKLVKTKIMFYEQNISSDDRHVDVCKEIQVAK
jgi:hypothetical protein